QIRPALDNYEQSLKLREKYNDTSGVAQCLSNMGVAYTIIGQKDSALSYFRKSLAIRQSIKDSAGMAYSLNNIGAIYKSENRMEEARANYAQCLAIYRSLNIKVGIANTLHNIGSTYGKEQPDTALRYFRESFMLYKAIHDKANIANSCNDLAIVHLALGQKDSALKYVTQALDTALSGGYAEPIRNAYYVMTSVDSAMGNYQAAFSSYKNFVLFRDSIANEKSRKSAFEKQTQYAYEKKEALLKSKAEAKLEQQKLINWFVGSSLVLALIFSLLLFNRYRLKQKNIYQQQLNEQQKQQAVAVMETQEQERKRIAEDLHDSLGHLLSTVKLHLQTFPDAQKPVAEQSLLLLNQASEEIQNITFNLMPRTLEEGGLVPALNELANKVTRAGRVKVLLHVHNMERFVLEKQSQFNIYRIVQEAVNNILKHAEASEINIQLVGQNDHISIMIEDDGKGFDPGEKKSGRGLKNIVTRSLWLKGSINIDSSPGRGTTITTEIPV
ncbi:MAG TPA: tetratricopeptide repeat protein, partial [Bacteroidia bacterium]|nr:tetratricopeptide repeat protein [Bacteroidia bacterium]